MSSEMGSGDYIASLQQKKFRQRSEINLSRRNITQHHAATNFKFSCKEHNLNL